MKPTKFFRIFKKMKWIRAVGKNIFLCLTVLLIFFYSFWFSLSDKTIKDFIIDQGFIAIGGIQKKWCSIELSQLRKGKIFVEKVKINFCSLQVLLLQRLPLVLQLDGGNILLNYPILASTGNMSINSDFAWNKLPIVSDYIKVDGNPFYALTAQYTIAQDLQISARLLAKQFILDNKQIRPLWIQSFLPKNIVFDNLEIQVSSAANNINIKVKSQGIFQGNITGIIVRKKKFFQSKISFKVSGILQSIEQLNPVIRGYIKPYLKGNAIQMKIVGVLANPKLEAL